MPAWSGVTLVTDQDLTARESSMPEKAKEQKRGARTPYDSKRALAKEEIRQHVVRRGYNPDYLLDPVGELKTAAVYLELALIYRDMGSIRGEDFLVEKAAEYQQLWEDERDLLVLSYDDSEATSEPKPAVRLGTVELRRA